MAAVAASLLSYLFPSKPGQSEDCPLEITAAPGLTTLLDLALFRANEGQLTATTCCSHALLACWLDTKHQSQLLLDSLQHEEEASQSILQCESFARQCLGVAMDAIERMSTDKFAESANMSDPYESISSSSSSAQHNTNQLSGVGAQGVSAGVINSKEETGRRVPQQQRKDCWESPRLICPDHVWADDCYQACQRWVRQLTKHPFLSRGKHQLSMKCDREVSLLIQLIEDDVPIRLYQFRQAMEAEAVVTKRLYLVKSEYRAPFRAFLEAHQTLLRAPPMELVESHLQTGTSKKQQKQFEKVLKTPVLIELLALERECELLEIEMGKALYPFSEFARSLDSKKARVKAVKGLLEQEDVPTVQDLIRRLKCILCRKAGPETSTGIRPILLDLQSVPRDDERVSSEETPFDVQNMESSIDELIQKLSCLSSLIKNPKAPFSIVKTSSHHHHHHSHEQVDFSVAIVKGCTETFDGALLKRQLLDWFKMVQRQHALHEENSGLQDRIRQAEMAMSIAGASEQSLQKVKERLEKMQTDREQRLEVLKELLEDLCLREMHLHVNLVGPEPTKSLELKETSTLGFLGIPLTMAGEPLPIG